MSESLLSPQTQDEQHVPATRSLPDHEAAGSCIPSSTDLSVSREE